MNWTKLIPRFIFGFLIVAFLVVAVTRYDELKALLKLLAGAKWQWVALAAFTQVFFYISYAASYRSAFRAVEVKSRVRDLVPALLASEFIALVTPGGGSAGLAMVVDDTTRRGNSAGRVTAGMILQLVADFCALTLIMIGSTAYLGVQKRLEPYVILEVGAMILVTVGMSFPIFLGSWKPALLQRLFAWLQRQFNQLAGRLKRKDSSNGKWLEDFASDYTGASTAAARFPIRLAQTLLALLIVHGVSIACLAILFLAFHQPMPLGILVSGYAVSVMMEIVSIVPAGSGVVEGSLALAFSSLGVPWSAAVAVSLAYRGLSFWLPLALGFLLIRQTKTFASM